VTQHGFLVIKGLIWIEDVDRAWVQLRELTRRVHSVFTLLNALGSIDDPVLRDLTPEL
jgi:uncharacterized membrane protein